MENKQIIKCIVDFVVNGVAEVHYHGKPIKQETLAFSKPGFRIFIEDTISINPNFTIGSNLSEFVKNNIEAFSYYGIFPDGNKIIYNGKPVIIR